MSPSDKLQATTCVGRGRRGFLLAPHMVSACAANAPGSSLGFWRRRGDMGDGVASRLAERSGRRAGRTSPSWGEEKSSSTATDTGRCLICSGVGCPAGIQLTRPAVWLLVRYRIRQGLRSGRQSQPLTASIIFTSTAWASAGEFSIERKNIVTMSRRSPKQ